ncbi:imelysin family protein [Dongia rigui]|uniref:Imelysin-like domain-containing protein n=1 Tax=Dongia rigui TaxID=940149 RepID=A0ABU5E463_9PROT|nr:imelysin family protein [Dongia rigui]MDY0874375.1 hypothetical protein [Dongia rigui]
MTTHDRHIAERKRLPRRHALALLGGAGLAALAPRHGFAVSFDFAGFNRRYIAEVIVPRFTRLAATCAAWSERIAPAVHQPSAGKVDMMGRRDDEIWDNWMAAEPFMYLPGPSQKREMELAGWARGPAGLYQDVDALLARSTPEDLSPELVRTSLIGQHSLEVMDHLLLPDGKDAHIMHDFYVAENGPTRTKLLQVLVDHMQSEAAAAGQAWAKIAEMERPAGITPRRMTAQFLGAQINVLGRLLRRELRPVPFALGHGDEVASDARRESGLINALEVVNTSLQSSAGFGALLRDDQSALKASLLSTSATALSLGYEAGGYPGWVLRSGGHFGMCCFCTTDMIEDERKRAEARSEKIRLQFDDLRRAVADLRKLMQTDLAEAISLVPDLKET